MKKILGILNDGFIKLGSDVEEEYRALTGGEPHNYIYANINFPDIKNLDFFSDYYEYWR